MPTNPLLLFQRRQRSLALNSKIIYTLFTAILLVFMRSVTAQTGGYTPFAWEQADLALLIPPDWSAAAVLRDDQPTLELNGEGSLITLQVLSDSMPDEELRPALDAALQSLDVIPVIYAEVQWFGRDGLSATGNAQPLTGFGRVGRLPDRRGLVIAGRGISESALNTIANSIVFSASSAPTAPSYTLVWETQFPEILPAETLPRIVDLAYSPFGQIYAVEASHGVLAFDATTGAYLVTYPFLNPSQPTSIAIDPSGTVYIGDSVCRCLQVLSNRTWQESRGRFGGGAPFHLSAAPDGSLYAVDRTAEGYAAQILSGERARTIPLNFNGSAPPLLAVDSHGQVTVVEWLSSLIDGETNAAVSLLEGDTPALQHWLATSPDTVNDIAVDPNTQLVLALADGRVALAEVNGILSTLSQEDAAPQALTFSPEGTLFIARDDGSIVARSASAPPEQTGDGTIRHDVPVQGTLNENVLSQEWIYEGTAGDQITISAVDLTRTDALDMAIRLIGPDGGEHDYNDDQRGADLYGRFDAQITDYVVRESGTYTIVVEWVQGSGTYTLGVSANRRFQLDAERAAHLEGALQDVFPVQRWIFEGQAGQVVTFTMLAESGNLDPALQLIQPGGSLLSYNDDASDPELGVNAQLFRVELPDSGVYVLEASRFEGSGRYSIVAVVNGE
jgi:streptogramin lyase